MYFSRTEVVCKLIYDVSSYCGLTDSRMSAFDTNFTNLCGVISHEWHFLCVWKLDIHPVVTAHPPTIWTKSSVVGVSSLKRSPSTSSTTTFPLVWWVRQWPKFAFYDAFLSLNDLVKIIHFEKATKFCENFPLLLTVCTVVKS